MIQGGILNVSKPEGMNSTSLVSIVKRQFKFKKVGHFGTLDPFATGVMLIGVDQGTKLSPYVMALKKEYRGVVKLGVSTDTLDPTGKVIATSAPPWPTEEMIRQEVKRWVGYVDQAVPEFSAVKIQGVRMYEAARKGTPLEQPVRKVVIDSIELLNCRGEEFEIEVKCSKGTYMRSLASDIAKGLGAEGMLARLGRNAIGKFRIEQAITVEELKSFSLDQLICHPCWTPLSLVLDDLPRVRFPDRVVMKILHGQVPLLPPLEGPRVRLCNRDGELVGLAKRECIVWTLERVFPI